MLKFIQICFQVPVTNFFLKLLFIFFTLHKLRFYANNLFVFRNSYIFTPPDLAVENSLWFGILCWFFTTIAHQQIMFLYNVSSYKKNEFKIL